jgi:hypothetical protein
VGVTDDDAREAARAEASRHILLYADKQLLKEDRLSELLAGFRARALKTIQIAGLLAVWQAVKLGLGLFREGGEASAALEATRDPITAAMLVFCLIVVAVQVVSRRRCAALIEALPPDDGVSETPST